MNVAVHIWAKAQPLEDIALRAAERLKLQTDWLTDLQSALTDAQAAYDKGQEALARGDWTAYGQAQVELEAALRRAAEAEARLTGEDDGQPA